MTNSKSTTIFSKIPFIGIDNNNKQDENKKISYWLEKLHIQREKVRVDNNRREKERLKTHPEERLEKERFSKEKAKDQMQLGIDAHAKTASEKNEADIQMINDLVKKSNRRIISISSAFPWSLFPDTIDVEEGRVTFKFSQFLSSQSHSVEIKDISNVFIETSIFFATLQVVSRTFVQNDIRISNLNKAKALKVQRIIEGLRTFAQHDINTSNYEIDELISKIEEFHSAHRT